MQEIPEIVTSIRQAAELTGLTEDTIRYYERIGLLPYAERKPNGHRRYTRDQILGIRFVMRLKATGMTLEEIKQYLELTRQGSGALAERYSLLEAHHDALSAEIAQLQETQRIIRYKLQHFRELAGNPDIASNNCEVPGDSIHPPSQQDAAPAVITPEEARTHGIQTLHQQMPSGERRFRLLSSDGSAYIRTEAPGQGGWQHSHYHKEIAETYIVQHGWIVYAGMDAAGRL
ncbi:MerR family transcriptional regulator [Paenibacillus borealis]|uniref:MerR family transcriptional regulator n=1 Tax=Paenibacillus borealis TaxID=160799 RepID=UPI0009DD5E30|nr:MerR family transcriptional regulator [Paenibacillus borealis]